MRTIIIGSKGMLGQEFMRQLGSRREGLRDTDVIGWGREDLDITNEQEVMEKINALKPNVVLNCAAYNNVDKAEDEPEVANAINGEAVGYLAQAAAKCGAAFVHFSSDYVFDGEKADGYKEDDTPSPISKYGKSKLLGEKRVVEVFGSHPPLIPPSGRGGNGSVSPPFQGGVRGGWYIIRTSRLFGPPGIGVTSKKSFPEMMLGFARAKGRIEAIDAEIGSPTYVKDLVEATLNLVARDFMSRSSGTPNAPEQSSVRGRQDAALPSVPASGIYHITNTGSCTWYEYAKAAVEFVGVVAEVVPVGPERFPRKAKRPENSTLLNTKLPPLRAWQDALREYLTQK